MVSLHRVGRLPPRARRHLVGNELCVAFATAGELWKEALAARWGAARRGGLDLWLDQTAVLPADLRVAQTWGAIAATAQLRGRPRPQHDTRIAACCIKSGLPLVTLKRQDFADSPSTTGSCSSSNPTIAAPGTGRENAAMAERHVWILLGELVVHGWDIAADRRGPAACLGPQALAGALFVRRFHKP